MNFIYSTHTSDHAETLHKVIMQKSVFDENWKGDVESLDLCGNAGAEQGLGVRQIGYSQATEQAEALPLLTHTRRSECRTLWDKCKQAMYYS